MAAPIGMPIIAIGFAIIAFIAIGFAIIAFIAIGFAIIAFIAIGLAAIAIGFAAIAIGFVTAPIPIIAVGICAAATAGHRGWGGSASRGDGGQQRRGGEGRGGGERAGGGGTREGRPKGAPCESTSHTRREPLSSHTRVMAKAWGWARARSLQTVQTPSGARTCIIPIIGMAGVAFGCALCEGLGVLAISTRSACPPMSAKEARARAEGRARGRGSARDARARAARARACAVEVHGRLRGGFCVEVDETVLAVRPDAQVDDGAEAAENRAQDVGRDRRREIADVHRTGHLYGRASRRARGRWGGHRGLEQRHVRGHRGSL